MKVEHIFCDICSKEILPNSWENVPCNIHLLFSAPCQSEDSRRFSEVCCCCTKQLLNAINNVIKQAKNEIPHTTRLDN